MMLMCLGCCCVRAVATAARWHRDVRGLGGAAAAAAAAALDGAGTMRGRGTCAWAVVALNDHSYMSNVELDVHSSGATRRDAMLLEVWKWEEVGRDLRVYYLR